MFIYSYSKNYAKARFCQNCHKGMTKMAYGMTIMSPSSVFVTYIFIKEINKRALYLVLHLIIFTFANSIRRNMTIEHIKDNKNKSGIYK